MSQESNQGKTMQMYKSLARTILTLLYLFFLTGSSFAEDIILEGKIIHVADGDTVTLLTKDFQQFKVRLYGIDTPEKAQAFGNRAKQFTASKVGNKTVTVKVYDRDRYGRLVGIVEADSGSSLNEELVKNGMAWVYDKYCRLHICKKWKEIEKEASKNDIGLWQDKHAMPPWEWRKFKKH